MNDLRRDASNSLEDPRLKEVAEGLMLDKWRKKWRTMKRYDQTSHIYDMRYEAEQRAKYEAALSRLPPRLGLVLDAGCGTGLLFSHIGDLAETIVGLDISERTLMLSKSRASGFKNVHLMVADADHMPFPHEVFNSVFAITLIQNSPDPSDTITELARVAKSDAAIVVTGLKRIFSLDEFEKLLRKAKLKVVIMESEALQCYVAVCAKHPSKSHRA